VSSGISSQLLFTWLNLNFLSLNLTETEILVTGPPSLTKSITNTPRLDLEATSIPSATVKNLGITFNTDISQLCKVSVFQLHHIAKLWPYISPKDTESLVYAFITSRRPRLLYIIFSGLPAHSISRLQYIQNSATRLLTYTKQTAHITPFLFKLHWLPVSSRITYKILILTLKSLNGLAPSYLSDLLSPSIPL